MLKKYVRIFNRTLISERSALNRRNNFCTDRHAGNDVNNKKRKKHRSFASVCSGSVAGILAVIAVFSLIATQEAQGFGRLSDGDHAVFSAGRSEAVTTSTKEIEAAIEAFEQDAASRKENKVIRVHLAGEPGDPIPAEAMDTDTASLLKLISEGLVILDENGNPAPGCARKWSVSDDGLKWTFRLREDLSWSDGKPLKAKVFEKMFRKLADPATEALYGHDLMKNIAGYEDVLNGDPDALQVSAEKDNTFVVRLSTPDPSFALKCASWSLLPIREQIEKDDSGLDWENVTGNGPYVIASDDLKEKENTAVSKDAKESPAQGFILKKNPYYLNELVPFEEVHWTVEGDVNREYSDLLNGQFHAVADTSGKITTGEDESDAEQENASAGLTAASAAQENASAGETRAAAGQEPSGEVKETVIEGTSPEISAVMSSQTLPDTIGILFNCDQKALKDSRVRSALSMAVDREYIASEILSGVYEPSSHQELFDTVSGEPDDRDQGTENQENNGNIARAAKLLKEAGYGDGKKFPVLTCLADENGSAFRIAEYIASEWKKLGIEVKIEKTKAKDLARKKGEGHFDVICGNILLPSDLPTEELEKFTTDNEENKSGFSSKKYDGLIAEAMKTTEQTKHEEKLEEAVRVLEDETPAAPLAAKNVSWLRLDDLDGILCDASGCWQLWKDKNVVMSETQLRAGSGAAQAAETGTGAEQASDQTSAEEIAADLAKAQKTGTSGMPVAQKATGTGIISRLISMWKKPAEDTRTVDFTPEPGSFMDRMFQSSFYFRKADQDAWLTSQAYILKKASENAGRLISLPKYTRVHLTGIGKKGYVRLTVNGKFCYLEADKVTMEESVLHQVRAEEKTQAQQLAVNSESMHPVRERELKTRAAEIKEENERILAEIAFQEALRTQTRNPNWDGPVLSRGNGSVHGPSGKETYYNLNMSGVVNIMRRMGNTDEYWVRDDGCKMLGNYIMCAANLRVHPRGSLVESSLGTCIVCDTGGFARGNSNQLDIAVTW